MQEEQATHLSVLLFDLGFTLINFEGNFSSVLRESYNVLADALIDLGCPLDKAAFAQKYREIISEYYSVREADLIERPVEGFLKKTLSHFSVNHLSEADLQKALEAMFTYTETFWKVEPDAHETLARLINEGFRLGLISNASNTPDLNRLIDNHDLRKYFEIIVISADAGIRKPDPRIFTNTLKKMGVKPEQAVMVGDTLNADILGAKKADIRSVWVTRRADRPENRELQALIQPDYEIQDLRALIPLIEQIR